MALVTTACSPASANDPLRLDRSFRTDSAPQVSVGNVSGLVAVRPGAGKGVTLSAQKVGGTPAEQDAHRIEIDQHGDRISVRTVCPGTFSRCGRVAVRYELTVPPDTHLDCRTVSAAIRVTGIQGALRLHSVSGTIETDGSLAAALRAKSVSGRLRIRGAHGPLKLSSVSGEIRVELRRRAERVELRSVSGTAQLLLAGGVGARLQLSTVSGAIDSALPLVGERRRGRRRLEAVLGDGAMPVRARTVSGSLRIAALD